MNRRDFAFASVASVASATTLLGAVAPAQAQPATPEAGKDYVRLTPSVNTNVPAGKIEVIEFFWYSCSHCNAFEPSFEVWIKQQAADVTLARVPIAFQQNANFVPQQKIYYTLETMGLLPTLHAAVFQAIFTERKKLTKDEVIFEWVATKGVDAKKFQEIYNSFAVANSVRRASQLQDQYRIEGVPSLGVAGKYYTDGTKAGSMAKALDVVNYLIAQERKGA